MLSVYVALVIRHAMSMRRIALLSVVSLSVCLYHILPHYLINDTIFRKKLYEKQAVYFGRLYSVRLKHLSF